MTDPIPPPTASPNKTLDHDTFVEVAADKQTEVQPDRQSLVDDTKKLSVVDNNDNEEHRTTNSGEQIDEAKARSLPSERNRESDSVRSKSNSGNSKREKQATTPNETSMPASPATPAPKMLEGTLEQSIVEQESARDQQLDRQFALLQSRIKARSIIRVELTKIFNAKGSGGKAPQSTKNLESMLAAQVRINLAANTQSKFISEEEEKSLQLLVDLYEDVDRNLIEKLNSLRLFEIIGGKDIKDHINQTGVEIDKRYKRTLALRANVKNHKSQLVKSMKKSEANLDLKKTLEENLGKARGDLDEESKRLLEEIQKLNEKPIVRDMIVQMLLILRDYKLDSIEKSKQIIENYNLDKVSDADSLANSQANP